MNSRQRRIDRRRFNRRYRASMADAERRLSPEDRAILDDWYRNGHHRFKTESDRLRTLSRAVTGN